MITTLLTLALSLQAQNGSAAAFDSYLAHVYSAQMSLQSDDTALALRWLSKAPKEHRGWEFDYLTARTDASLWSRKLERSPSRFEFSKDGRHAAVSNLDGTVSVYDGETLQERGLLEGHTNQVWGLAFSPDGKTLATTSRDLSVRLWDVASLKEKATIGKHPTTPYACEFSPDGKWLVTPGWQMHPETNRPVGLVSVWDVDGQKLHKQWFATDHPISSAAFSPDGTKAALGCWEFQVLVYDTSDWSLVTTIHPEESESYKGIDWIEFSPDGKSILTACKDQTVRLYEAETGRLVTKYAGKGNATCARFSDDGLRVFTSWTDQNLRLYTIDGAPLETLRGHTDAVRCFALNGDKLYSIGEDRTLRAWSEKPGATRFDAGEQCWSAVPSPDARLIATGGEGALVRIWKADGSHVRDLSGAEALVVDVAWSPDGTRVVAGSNDGTARVWSVADGKELLVLRVGDAGQVRGVAWAPDGGSVIVGQGAHVAAWNAETGKEVFRVRLDSGGYCVAVSPDGRWIAASGGGTVSLLDAKNGRLEKSFEGAGTNVFEVTFSPDGSLLAASGGSGQIHLWSVESGEKLRTISDMTLSCWALAFSPDGKRLASTGYDFTMRLFDVATGAQVFMVRDMPGIGFDVQWTPDGRRLIHADTDGRVTVFDAGPKGR